MLSDSIISGRWSNVLNTFSEVKFYIADDEDREVDLNDIDISMTVVLRGYPLKNPHFLLVFRAKRNFIYCFHKIKKWKKEE